MPPEAAAYQFIVPELAVADSATVPVPQREPGVTAVIEGVATTVIFTVAVVEPQPLVAVTV